MKLQDYIKDITDITQYIGTPAFCGVRVNPIKYNTEKFHKNAPFEIEKCKFYKYGYYVSDEQKTGNHPLHFGGAYYVQEPSAMSALTALKVSENDAVLDMCAAPGSKSTAIAAECRLLVANEINTARCQTLIGNIERLGISNAMVLNSDSEAVGNAFIGYFDKVLVDSPCSGEGMFRKHPSVLDEWTVDLVKMCAKRSLEVLTNASKTLKAGGRLVYSTCTYNLEENEKTILEFLKNNPDFKVVDTGLDFGSEGLLGLNLARRITIADGGEGHFVCALERVGTPPFKKIKPFKLRYNFDVICDFAKGTPKFLENGEKFGLLQFGDSFYAVQDGMPDVSGVRVMRVGVKLGTLVSKTLKPDHHFFMSAHPDCLKSFVEVSEADAFDFYKGQTLSVDPSLRGYTAVMFDGVCIGFGKAVGGTLKNHLPKGLRI